MKPVSSASLKKKHDSNTDEYLIVTPEQLGCNSYVSNDICIIIYSQLMFIIVQSAYRYL